MLWQQLAIIDTDMTQICYNHVLLLDLQWFVWHEIWFLKGHYRHDQQGMESEC